jgi:hypothetical protein
MMIDKQLRRTSVQSDEVDGGDRIPQHRIVVDQDEEVFVPIGAATMTSSTASIPTKHNEMVDLTVNEQDEEERYIPSICTNRFCSPFTCFFKVHGGAGKIPALTDGQWATLFACCLCGFLNAYDWELWPLALTQFQRDLNVSESDIGLIGSAIRVGNALSFPVSALGDIYGRKVVSFINQQVIYFLGGNVQY